MGKTFKDQRKWKLKQARKIEKNFDQSRQSKLFQDDEYSEKDQRKQNRKFDLDKYE